MNEVLVDIEERIKLFYGKESNTGRSFSLLDIARRIDPKHKHPFYIFEIALRKLEIEGILYFNKEDNTYEEFPSELGFVQCSVLKNKSGEGLINMPDGRKFKLEKDEANTLLSGDLIIIKPTNKRSGNRMIATFEKIVKRKNGLVVVQVIEDEDGIRLEPVNAQLGYPIYLDESTVANYNNHDLLLVKIDDLDSVGLFKAELIKAIDLSCESIEAAIETKEYDDEYILNHHLINSESVQLELEEESYTVQGKLTINKYGEGIVIKDGKSYMIKPEFFNDALNGDIVEIRPSKLKAHGHLVSRVESVIKRNDGLVTVEVSFDKKGDIVLTPLNYDLKHKIVLPKTFAKTLVDGERFVARIGDIPARGYYEAQYVRNIGHKDDPDADIRLVAAEHDIVEPFTDGQLEEAYSLPAEVLPEEKVGRLDYTKKNVFSIDGAKTKDRDDALSIEQLENGNYLVGVHISDVTHYIHPGMQLWDAIMDRATSVYMIDSVIPMLPHIISNGICSLNPDTERLTLSCMMEIDANGNIVSFDFKDVVIKSKKAMVYDDVNEILEEGNVPSGYEPFVDDLVSLNNLAIKLAAKREARGAICFDDVENDVEVEFDENGKPIEFKTRARKSGEKLIESFMLAAGECYAEYMVLPSTYRVHECPEIEALEDAIGKLKKMGVKVVGSQDIQDGKYLQRVISSIQDQTVRSAAANILLRSMKRARIDVDEEIGHYALAAKKIGRFTSPIRRAEDSIAHLQIRKQRDCLYNPFNLQQEVDTDYEWIKQESKYISMKQYQADQAEKDAIYVKMSKFIEEHIGEEFQAIVTYVNKSGIFIKTSNGVVGKIDIHDYDGDTLFFDEKKLIYRGRATGVIIRIGTPITVTALDTHREYKTINFGVGFEDCKKLVYKKGV